MTRERFLDAVLKNPNNRAILERAAQLRLPDWWLTGGAVFQTVWNVLDGRDPAAGIEDYDIFYFDRSDISEESECAARHGAAALFDGTGATVEVCNEARVHVWYESYFGRPSAPFASSRDAIDHFVSPACMYAVTRANDGELRVYAPHGYADLFNRVVCPNPRNIVREVYEAKAARWLREWPRLTVLPCPD